MAEAILMPRLSDTMTEGVIAGWHKKVGDPVKKGDLLADVETDKATMELESYKEGTVLYIGAKDGEKLQVDDLLLIVGNQGEDYKALLESKGKPNGSNGSVAASGDDTNTRQPEQNGLQDQETDTKVKGDGQPPEGKPATEAPASGGQSLDLSKMEEVVLMPRLSDTMTEGVIAGWQKNVGDTVKKGDVLADIETDKATMELESYKDGKLLYQGAKPGEKIQVNELLCIIGPEGFDINPIIAAAKGGGTAAPAAEAPAPAAQPAQAVGAPPASTQSAAPVAAPAPQVEEQKVVNEGRIFASPLAKKLAEDKGIDLKYVKGSGDNGRITKIDVDGYKAPAAPAAQPASTAPATAQPAAPQAQPEKAAPVSVPAGQEKFEEIPVSQMRKVIARRLSESLFTAPHFYVTMSIDMDAAVAARAKLNETSPVKISFNDLVLKAVAVALKQHPKVNSSWLGDKIRVNYHVNIGVAVAVDEGLLVPVVRFADTKSLSQISTEVKDFAKKAKDKKLQPADWAGSTFTISNLGMFGVDEFTAIINQPDSCILAVSGIAQVPVVKGGQVVPGNVMKVTLSCDHRVVDGATGAAFLQTVKSLLEEPIRMMI